jgi:hypothetical protein
MHDHYWFSPLTLNNHVVQDHTTVHHLPHLSFPPSKSWVPDNGKTRLKHTKCPLYILLSCLLTPCSWRGKWTNTLQAGWGVACECAAGTRGVGSGNLARRRRGSAGGPMSFFWAGRGELERGAVSPYSEGWEEGQQVIIWGLILPGTRARGYFSTCHTVPALPIGFCHAGAEAGAPAIYLGSRAR